jgi:NADPH:quinone reductase-like Zn-dependent oxidoreductase
MRQIWIAAHGGPEVLQLREAPDPQPAAGELRVRVRASGINFADILARKGLYPDAPRPPMVVGYEVSGVVDAIGAGVGEPWLGREVVALVRFGGYADVVAVPAPQVFAKPARLDFAQAVALPVQYLTAWQLLAVMGAVSAGDSVLIHNAGGG